MAAFVVRVVIALVAGELVPQPGYASSSGLNNIPTADTAPNLTLVIQGYSLFGAERSPDHFAAFKFGIDPWQNKKWRNRFEFGLDSRVSAAEAGPSVLQAKWAAQPDPRGPAFSIGVANVASSASERRRAGEPFSFVVVSQDLKLLRAHGGYGLQGGDNRTAILGIDSTFTVFHRSLMLRADAVQTERRQNWISSVGGLFAVCKYFALESWFNQPAHDRSASFVVKLNFVVPLLK